MPQTRINFTKAALAALPTAAPGQRYSVYDHRRRGLCLLTTSRGVKTFYVLRKYKGRTERVLVGRFPETTIEQARRRAGQVNSALDGGINPNELKRQERGELTVHALYLESMERHARPHNRRPDKAEYHYAKYLSEWGAHRLSTVTRADVQSWHARLGRNHGTRTANIAVTLLRSLFNRAKDWEFFAGENPTRGIRKFKEHSRERFLHPDEIKRFLEALRAEVDTDARDFFLLLLFAGARKSDVLRMRWCDVNLESGVWTIPSRVGTSTLGRPTPRNAVCL
jgi:hypothetical protein